MSTVKVLVVTGRDHEWCKRVGHELEVRQRKGQIPADFQVLVVDDPKCSVGSGGATLNALLVTVEYLSVQAGYHIINDNVLTNAQIVILHTGRLFEYCALERLFAPLPLVQNAATEEGSESCVCVFDYLMDTLLVKLAPAYSNGVWVCSSDMLLCVPSNAHTSLPQLANNELLAISVPVSRRYARNHGVFVLNNTDDRVSDIHYQQGYTDNENEQLNAGNSEKVPVVTGVVYLTPQFAGKLIDLHVTSPLDGCTYAGLDSGSPPVRLSLFLDVLLSLCSDVSEERFLGGDRARKQLQTDRFASERCDTKANAESEADDLDTQIQRQARKVLWKKLRGAFRLRCAVLQDGFYQHLSVTASEYMCSLRTLSRCVAHFDALASADCKSRFTFSAFAHSFDLACNNYELQSANAGSQNADKSEDWEADSDFRSDENLVINSLVHDVKALRGCVVLNSVLETDSVRLGEHSFANGLRDADGNHGNASVQLPSRLVVQAFHVRLQSQVCRVIAVWGTEDRLFVPVNSNDITFCNQPFADFCKRTGVQHADLWPAETASASRTLFLAKLFPANCVSLRGVELVNWLAGASTDVRDAEWRQSERLSLQDVLLNSDLRAEFETLRDAFYTVAQRRMKVVLCECRNVDLKRLYRSAVLDARDMQLVAYLHRLAREEMSVAHPDQLARAFANVAELLAAKAAGAGTLRSGPASNREWAPALDALRNGAVRQGVLLLEAEMRNWCDSPTRLIRAARHYEAACQIEISKAVRTACAFVRVPVLGSSLSQLSSTSNLSELRNQWVTADVAARIDLAGGWSDTPPICYELGGAVCNVGVLVDGRKPIGARARLSSHTQQGNNVILCRLGHSDRPAQQEQIVFTLAQCSDLRDYNQPNAVGALLKACLVYTRTVQLAEEELHAQLLRLFGASLEFEIWSELPAGSGLGGSSILIAAVLAVLWRLRGLSVSLHDLVHQVLNVEQLMTTGGGWQDQVGAVVGGGVKIGRSVSGLPLHVTFENVLQACDAHAARVFMLDVLQPRMMLVYTGRSRLARNLLQDVLRNWYARDETVYETERRLIQIAEQCFSAFCNAHLVQVANCVNEYWRLKKLMAPGSEPPRVTRMIDTVRQHVMAATLCGAGGGGFLFLLLNDPQDRLLVEQKLLDLAFQDVKVHQVTIDFDGLQVH